MAERAKVVRRASGLRKNRAAVSGSLPVDDRAACHVCGVAQPGGLPRYDVRYAALTPGRMRSDQGVIIEVKDGLKTLGKADIIIIPAWSDPEVAAPAELSSALRKAHKKGALIVGLCLGAFVLGDAGLLDGKEATTHWAVRDVFARRFPDVMFRPDVLYVDDDRIVTSAGTVAAIDCCLHLIRQRHGYEAVNHTARFREATGTTVTKWLNAERVARAQQLLETTERSIECIASEVGFATSLSLRQQFSSQLGTSPSDYRRTFLNPCKQ